MPLKENREEREQTVHFGVIHDECMECGSQRIRREGRCETCEDCGWSTC